MAFQIKDFASSTASMLNWFKAVQNRITDFTIGSVARTLIESPAIEIDQLYQEMFHGLKEAIPVATYQSFNFQLLPAQAASGIVTFTAAVTPTVAIIIPAGTILKNASGSASYRTAADAVINPSSTTANVLVIALAQGTAGNTIAGTVTVLQGSINGITSVTNAIGFFNGRDLEKEDERKIRFQGFISTIARGTNAAIYYGASTGYLADANGLITESVRMVNVVEPYLTDNTKEIALINVYIHNGVGSTSSALTALVQTILVGTRNPVTGIGVPGWKAAGVRCNVIAATELPAAITGAITLLPNYDGPTVIVAAAAAVSSYLLSLNIGEKLVWDKIIQLVRECDGVYKFVLSVPSADVTPIASQKIMPGTLTLTAA